MINLQNVPACSNDDDRVSTRRNSLFVKRGSVTMEPIKKVDLEEVYTVNKQVSIYRVSVLHTVFQLGTGRFGYIKLAEHKQSKQRIAIKFFPRPQTKQVESAQCLLTSLNFSFSGRLCAWVQLLILPFPAPEYHRHVWGNVPVVRWHCLLLRSGILPTCLSERSSGGDKPDRSAISKQKYLVTLTCLWLFRWEKETETDAMYRKRVCFNLRWVQESVCRGRDSEDLYEFL